MTTPENTYLAITGVCMHERIVGPLVLLPGAICCCKSIWNIESIKHVKYKHPIYSTGQACYRSPVPLLPGNSCMAGISCQNAQNWTGAKIRVWLAGDETSRLKATFATQTSRMLESRTGANCVHDWESFRFIFIAGFPCLAHPAGYRRKFIENQPQ